MWLICLVLERDAKLNELDDRATTLQQGAEMFDRNAGKIQKKFWFQNMKMNSSVRAGEGLKNLRMYLKHKLSL